MKIILTGGARFIGSCLLRMLNDKGIEDIIVVDNISTSSKWLNLNGKTFSEYVHKDNFLSVLSLYSDVDAVIHMGACSSTTEEDFDYLWNNNVEYSKVLYNFCVQHDVPFIYASSASTYGDGSNGFNDEGDISLLRPLNRYGYSKQLFDLWVEKQSSRPPQCVGLKFFNVYGPNEYHKTGMYSMVYQGYNQVKDKGDIALFKSTVAGLADGEQKRDFVYVKDVCKVVTWFLENKSVSGLYNVGTGIPRSFNSLAQSIFTALGMPQNIKYVDMPKSLSRQYQSYTAATMTKLRNAGYTQRFYSLEEGVDEYVNSYLKKGEYY